MAALQSGGPHLEIPSMTMITASMLYNLVQCPHRVALDQHGDPSQRDPVDEFVQLLWERGSTYEREVVEGLDEEFVDTTQYRGD